MISENLIVINLLHKKLKSLNVVFKKYNWILKSFLKTHTPNIVLTEQKQNPLQLLPESIAQSMKSISGKSEGSSDDLIYCHLYGVVGDWYLSEISEDRAMAFGFRIINSEPVWEMDNWLTNSCEWGDISINSLQKLVNEKFLKEKDIRFLITRDLFWEPTKFSEINIKQNTLLYPGTTNRKLS